MEISTMMEIRDIMIVIYQPLSVCLSLFAENEEDHVRSYKMGGLPEEKPKISNHKKKKKEGEKYRKSNNMEEWKKNLQHVRASTPTGQPTQAIH